MVELREVDQSNIYDCLDLKRKSTLYVGDAAFVLAEAYVFRQNSTAYAICDDDIVTGLVILLDRPEEDDRYYSFTDLFIADDFLGKGYGNKAVERILQKFKSEGLRNMVKIEVHSSNQVAKRIYEHYGFVKTGAAEWNERFDVMKLELQDESTLA